MRRLTNKLLESIVEMAAMIEADGSEQMQGYTTDIERDIAYSSCLDAGSWAAEMLRHRQSKNMEGAKS